MPSNSPSTGAYPASVMLLYRPPAIISRHLSGQHSTLTLSSDGFQLQRKRKSRFSAGASTVVLQLQGLLQQRPSQLPDALVGFGQIVESRLLELLTVTAQTGIFSVPLPKVSPRRASAPLNPPPSLTNRWRFA